ncbi:MAG TPA: pantoate--beta-alanine ligase, partial [Bacteroidales bacterium]|nr:pantoate--beta-alanine ligase [Bacteroidales bacterium]
MHIFLSILNYFTTSFAEYQGKMKVTKTVREIRNLLKADRSGLLGFVPTMGALHQGHVSLVINAVKKCPLVVVSIYVNPSQFNDTEDLKKYPRTNDSDLALLDKTLREKDIVFIPDDNEIYPVPDNREFDFGNAGRVMEALYRPGHFNGVGRVVTRLFDIVQPDMAFFGMKDFQQVAIVKELVKQNNYRIRIVGNPIIREPDGLAMSSRNIMLEPEMRKKAPEIYSTISKAAGMLPHHDIPEIRKF